MTKPNDIPKLLTIADLSLRWDMPRQSLHDKKGENKFPLPLQYVANNRTALFLESDIIEYEKENPYIKTRAQREARRNFIFKLYMDVNDEQESGTFRAAFLFSLAHFVPLLDF